MWEQQVGKFCESANPTVAIRDAENVSTQQSKPTQNGYQSIPYHLDLQICECGGQMLCFEGEISPRLIARFVGGLCLPVWAAILC